MSDPQQPLPYETPKPAEPITIERFPDGGTTVTIRLHPIDMIWPALRLWGALAILCILVWMYTLAHVADSQSALIVLGLPFLGICIGMIALRARRVRRPIIIGISPNGVYFEDPRRLVRVRQHFRRGELLKCQPVEYEHRNRSGELLEKRYFLEMLFRSKLPIQLLDGAERERVIEVSEALRQALGWDSTPLTVSRRESGAGR